MHRVQTVIIVECFVEDNNSCLNTPYNNVQHHTIRTSSSDSRTAALRSVAVGQGKVQLEPWKCLQPSTGRGQRRANKVEVCLLA